MWLCVYVHGDRTVQAISWQVLKIFISLPIQMNRLIVVGLNKTITDENWFICHMVTVHKFNHSESVKFMWKHASKTIGSPPPPPPHTHPLLFALFAVARSRCVCSKNQRKCYIFTIIFYIFCIFMHKKLLVSINHFWGWCNAKSIDLSSCLVSALH